MEKRLSQIRDIELIEKELNSANVGIAALCIKDENIIQKATTYIYLDKNIYFFFNIDSELYEKIQFDTSASFTILKNEKAKKNSENFKSIYHVISISILGLVKKVDEQKLLEELRKSYLKKYSRNSSMTKENSALLGKSIIIDTEEIQAFEEIGG
ncbi:MAG: hypothetical protein ABI550_03220 [Ignavibacteriaceae bacterium]